MIHGIVNFFHLLAAAVWIGGMVYIHFVLLPSVSKIEPGESSKLQGIAAKRFSIIAWGSLLILLITGYIKTPANMFFDTSTNFGAILFVKQILVIAVIIVGMIIATVVVPGLRNSMPKPGEKPTAVFLSYKKKLETFASINLTLGVFILICASMLW